MSQFRTSTHRQQVCHALQLPEALRRRRQSIKQSQGKGRKGHQIAGFSDLPQAPPPREPVVRVVPVPPKVDPPKEPKRDALEVMERRLLKLTKALESQESLLLEMRQRGGDDTGLASTFREVQGLPKQDPRFDRKNELMQRIFISNQELRERIISTHKSAE